MNHDKIEIDHETRAYIIDNLVEPYYKETIKNTIEGKKIWRTLGISFETLSKVLVAVGGIVSFSSGYYHSENLSFFAGSISCLSLALLQLSSFSYKENKKQSEELNMLLKKLKLDTIPELERNVETSCNANTKSPLRESTLNIDDYNTSNSIIKHSNVNHSNVNHSNVNHSNVNDNNNNNNNTIINHSVNNHSEV